MASVEVPDTPQCKLAHSILEAISARNINGFANKLHRDFRHSSHPRSLNNPGLSTKEEWLQGFQQFLDLWAEDSKMTYHSFIEVPGKVVVHFTGKAMTKIGAWAWYEIMLTFHIITDEDGSLKVIRLDEFTDSKAWFDLSEAVEKAKANKPSA